MATGLVKFFRGTKANYDTLIKDESKKASVLDGIYFVTDRSTIYMNGVEYGGFNTSLFNGVIKSIDSVTNNNGQITVTFTKYVNGKDTQSSLSAGQLTTGQITRTATNKGTTAKPQLAMPGTTVESAIVNLAQGIGNDSVATQINSLKTSLKASSQGGEGKYIQSISQANGIITAKPVDLNSTNVKHTKTTNTTGTTVSEALQNLGAEISKLPTKDTRYKIIEQATPSANMLKTYVLQSSTDGSTWSTVTGSIVDIPKDRSLKSVTITDDNGIPSGQDGHVAGPHIKFEYNIADGDKIQTIYLSVNDILAEVTYGAGLQYSNGTISVKKDAETENYLDVTADGIKVTGIDAIKTTAKAAYDVKITGSNHISVTHSTTGTGGIKTFTIQDNCAPSNVLDNVSGTATVDDGNQISTLKLAAGKLSATFKAIMAKFVTYTRKTTETNIKATSNTVQSAIDDLDSALMWIDAGEY